MTMFIDQLDAAATRNRSLLCVGLDPWRPSLPIEDIAEFNRAIIAATSDLVCAYKPQWAFYEAEGFAGLEALQQTIAAVPDGIPVILDVKRGDLGSVSTAYAKAAFEVWGAGAVTVSPYMGRDSIQPFLDYADRGVFVIVRTSNPGATEFQSLGVGGTAVFTSEDRPARLRRWLTRRRVSRTLRLYEYVASQVRQWNESGNVGLVVGATAPEELARVRSIAGDMPLLIPGIGAQGGDLESSVRNGTDAHGRRAVISASRSVIYASQGADFADAARAEAMRLRDAINAELDRMGKGWS